MINFNGRVDYIAKGFFTAGVLENLTIFNKKISEVMEK
jgi:hypothetical protein